MKRIKINKNLLLFTKKEGLVFFLILACIFQFIFFFTPVLAAEVLDDDSFISLGELKKSNEALIVQNELSPLRLLAESVNLSNFFEDADYEPSDELLVFPEFTEEELLNQGIGGLRIYPDIRIINSSMRVITAYNSDPAQTDDTPCITANGFDLCAHWEEDSIAANFLKFNTKVRIPDLFGDRVFVVRDRMNKRFSDRVDVWMKEIPDARQFGVKVARIEVIEIIEE